jgi:hypothetical protein
VVFSRDRNSGQLSPLLALDRDRLPQSIRRSLGIDTRLGSWIAVYSHFGASSLRRRGGGCTGSKVRNVLHVQRTQIHTFSSRVRTKSSGSSCASGELRPVMIYCGVDMRVTISLSVHFEGQSRVGFRAWSLAYSRFRLV